MNFRYLIVLIALFSFECFANIKKPNVIIIFEIPNHQEHND